MYVALLRGVNVGGKNRVVMKELKQYFEEAGFTNVKTYINSGNIIFESDLEEHKLSGIINKLIVEKFELDIPVYIVSYETLKEAMNHAPDWWGAVDEEFYDNGIFLFDEISFEEISENIGAIKEEYEKIAYYPPLIFHSGLREFMGRTSYSKIAASKFYAKVTIRNANTCKKLLELMEKEKSG